MALGGRCPLPVDPGYEHTSSYTHNYTLEASPAGRIRPEAVDIARRHTVGIIAQLLSNESDPVPVRKSKPKVNHTQANKRRIKEIQLRCESRQREMSDSKSLPPRVNKYDHIPSKLSTEYLSKENNGAAQYSSDSRGEQPHSSYSDTPSVTDDNIDCVSCGSSLAKKQRNFIAENVSRASSCNKIREQPKKVLMKQEQEKKETKFLSHKRGVVPQYLRERKEQWKREEDERIANLPDPSVPTGHTLMSSGERLKTLDTLKQHYTQIHEQLQSLSLTSDTLRIRTKKSQLQSKLVEIEDAIGIFSKPKVFIKIDS